MNLPVLFITEDNKNIYHGMQYYYKSFTNIICKIANKNEFKEIENVTKFSTEKNAKKVFKNFYY